MSGIPFGVEHIRKAWRKLLWCLWGSFTSNDEGLTGFAVRAWQRTFLHSENAESHTSFTSENPCYGRNRWIQDDWVSDEEIMDAILTDGSKSKAMNNSEENIFLEDKWFIWEKESWQPQSGIGSLRLWKEPSKTTQRSCSWPQNITCMQGNQFKNTHYLICLHRSRFVLTGINMLLTLLL